MRYHERSYSKPNIASGMNQYAYYQERWSFTGPRITWAVQRLILANVLVFALQQLWDPLEVLLLYRGGYTPEALDVLFGFQAHRFLAGQVWKPLTYQFLHGGLMHLFMNMLWLYLFGPQVERVLGTRQFFRFYLLCGGLGVMAVFVPHLVNYVLHGSTGATANVIGASGAVMGVMVAFAITDPERQFYLFPLPVPLNARALILIVIAMNVITALSGGGVSVSTHFGGMAVGYLYMKFIPRINDWNNDRRRAGRRPNGRKSWIPRARPWTISSI